jgi:hypothetical protein
LQALSELATTLSRQISWHSFDELTSVQHRKRLRAILQLQLFTVHHQRDPQLEIFRRNFLPLQVGCALTETDIGILRDDQHGQLSANNRNYCELTAFDEIARSAHADYVGVMHYRRIFTVPKPLTLISKDTEYLFRVLRHRLGLSNKPVERHVTIKISSPEVLETEARALNNYLLSVCERVDIVTPIPVKYYGITLREQYARAHPVMYYDRFLSLLSEMHPELDPFVNTIENSQSYYLFNMFIMRRKLFTRYWKILYSTLAALQQEIDLKLLDTYQERVFGFLAERFMAIFVRYICATERARLAHLPVAVCNLES